MRQFRRILLLGAAGAIAFAGAATAQEFKDTQIPLTGEKVEGAPFTIERDWGTFTLADRIAEKVRNGEKMNYVFSYQASGIPLFSPQYAAGAEMGCKMAQQFWPMDCTAIAPVQNDANQQVAQIEAKLAAGEIDCIGIEPVDSNSLTAITNRMIDEGIPVFTAGVPTNGREFTRFTQVPLQEGKYVAEAVLQWMKDNGKDLKVFAVSGGDPTQEWAQGRMKSFVETIKAAIPDAEFITTEANGLNTSYEPGQTYEVYRSFLTANPNVQVIENVDIGAEHAARAIESLGMTGQVFTVGWNSSHGQLDAIEKGIQIAQFDQRWPDQAGFGAVACAALFKNGEILPNTQTLKAVFSDGVAQAREELNATMGQQ